MAAVAEIEEETVGNGDQVRRSGEYRDSPETAAYIKAITEKAAADARRDLLIEQLTRSVDSLVGQLKQHEAAATVNAAAAAATAAAINSRLAVIDTTQKSHGEQLETLWGRENEKRSAWNSLWPTVVASVISTILGGAITMAVIYNNPPAPAAPTAKTGN